MTLLRLAYVPHHEWLYGVNGVMTWVTGIHQYVAEAAHHIETTTYALDGHNISDMLYLIRVANRVYKERSDST
jgi:energy-converting hydrogenase Eha subunit F